MNGNTNIFRNLTWKCQICGEVRPDDKISVLSKPIMNEGRVVGSQNIRYCNDRAECRERAKTFSFFKDRPIGEVHE